MHSIIFIYMFASMRWNPRQCIYRHFDM